MAISTRSSALSTKKETVEGVPEAPSAGTDFIALQDDFSMTPAFDTLENAERLNSLGKAKSLLGLENPTATTSHYWRGSGVEGTCPNYGPMLEASLGSEISGLTERDVVSATTSTITVDTGEGVEFPVGRPMLIKDATNGYSVRWSSGVTGDVIDLSFVVPVAPAATTLLGDPCYYAPVNSGHPTLSVWHYIGNAPTAALELMTGSRVSSVDVAADAGSFINASYSMEGIEYYFDPKTNTASQVSIDFTDDNGAFVATIEAKTYKDPIDVAEAVAAAMNAADPLETFTCTYSATDGKYTIATSTSAVLELDFVTGPNLATSASTFIGFAATDLTGALTYTSDTAQDFSASVTPVFDDASPLVAKSNEVLIGEGDSSVCFEASSVGFSISTPKADILSVCSQSGKSGSIQNERSVTITLVALLENYEADNFHNFHTNQDVKFQWTAGEKVAGDWQAGKTVSAYAHTATISEYEITSEDNLATLNMTLTTFVNSDSDGEFFMGQV